MFLTVERINVFLRVQGTEDRYSSTRQKAAAGTGDLKQSNGSTLFIAVDTTLTVVQTKQRLKTFGNVD